MEIKNLKYSIEYDNQTETIYLNGKLRFIQTDSEFYEIADLFRRIIEEEPPQVIVNLERLEFLNSLGISMISKFVIKIRNKKSIHVIVKASNTISWQRKSLVNLQRIMPSLEIVWI